MTPSPHPNQPGLAWGAVPPAVRSGPHPACSSPSSELPPPPASVSGPGREEREKGGREGEEGGREGRREGEGREMKVHMMIWTMRQRYRLS